MTRTPVPWFGLVAAVGLALPPAAARAGDGEALPLQLRALATAGPRATVTEAWGALRFTLANPNPTGRDARLLVFYADQTDVQYGRDVWVPGRAEVTTWISLGPAPARAGHRISRDLEILLYDRTGGHERLVLPPGRRRVRSQTFLYRKRGPSTSLMLDTAEGDDPDEPHPPPPKAVQGLRFVQTFAQACSLVKDFQTVPAGPLPPTAEAFDGTDLFILAARRLADDPPGQRALRHWLEQGGQVWVMLDLADPDTAARLLGDDLGFRVVGRSRLTTVQIQSHAGGLPADKGPVRELEEPVDLVRVVLTPADTVLHSVNGWPASFTRRVGRGMVLVTTLGARGWVRPRQADDPRSPDIDLWELPVPLPPLTELAVELQPTPPPRPFPVDAFRPLLAGEIGYAVVGPGTAGLIFGAFLLAVLVLGVGLRRSHRPELLGWLGPAVALAAAAVFLALGEASRRAVPATVAVAELVDAVPGGFEQPVTGLAAAYRPDGGPAEVGSAHGGQVRLDMSGLEGQTRRRVVTDIGAWHWENLALPAGVRLGPFRFTARAEPPPAAVAHFGPDGLEGRLTTGPFREPADPLLVTPTGRPLAVRLRPDGGFSAGDADRLPPGQYLTGAVLSDRQQRRQEVYRQLFAAGAPTHLEGRSVLLAWTEPAPVPFTLEAGARTTGSALLAVPVEFERPPAGTRVTVPRGFIPYDRIIAGRVAQPTLQSPFGVDMHLRFRLPPSVLPLQIERARLFATVNAPSRRVTVAARAGGRRVTLLSAEGPTGPIRLDVTRPDVLRPDPQGGLHLDFAVSNLPRGMVPGKDGAAGPWSVASLELEITGRTPPAE